MINLLYIAFAGLLLLSSPVAAQSGGALYLTHANVVDVQSGGILRDATVEVRDGKIARVTRDDDAPPAGAAVIDIKGKYLLPGLIDAHVHIRDRASARRALESGVTTARSMGVAHFTDVGMGKLARAGAYDGPELLAAGYHVRWRPDDGFFFDHPELADLMGKDLKGESALRRMAQALLQHDIHWIKVNATARAGLPQTDPREPYYSADEMRVLVEEGARKNVPVAAHAHGDEGGRAAVLAGVKSIEHGTYLSETTLRLMKERGAYLVPTIAVVSDLTVPGGDYDDPVLEIRGRHMLPRVREMAANAYRLGVKMVAATDTGYGPESVLRLSQELVEFVNLGMTPLEALQAATLTPAEMLGVAGHTGRIAEGLDADLLVVERDPLIDVAQLHDPLLIVNNGKVIVNRLEW